MDNSVFTKKEDCSTRLLNLSNEFLTWISANFPEQLDFFENQISDNVTSLLSSEKPKIMVYGIYNSGKSTLVNALCKEKKNCEDSLKLRLKHSMKENAIKHKY